MFALHSPSDELIIYVITLDNAWTLGISWRLAIKFKYGGVLFTADTPEEAAQTMALLRERDEKSARQEREARIQAMLKEGRMEEVHEFLTKGTGTWTPKLFFEFIDRLGKTQREVLSLLVSFRHATDEELRACVNVPNNQALAGVLSGISKQAATLDIDARDIFSFENLRNAGKRRSNYKVANKFAEIAARVNWPGPQLPPRSNPSK